MARPTLPDGWHAKYKHRRLTGRGLPVLRNAREAREAHAGVLPRGGVTIALVFDSEGRLAAEGVASCSAHDNFNKQVGRDIALGRALAQCEGVRT